MRLLLVLQQAAAQVLRWQQGLLLGLHFENTSVLGLWRRRYLREQLCFA